jgi:hypothetical protein
MACQEFDEALLEAIDFAFRSLSPSIRIALYFHLEKTFRLTRRRIPRRIQEFDEALRFIFKDGALFLEKMILERLCKRLNVGFDRCGGLDFVESILEMRRLLSSNATSIGELTVTTNEKEGRKRIRNKKLSRTSQIMMPR